MDMMLNYSRAPYRTRPFGPVEPIIDATDPLGAIGQIFEFLRRRESFRVGVPDTSFFPFSGICKLLMTFPSGTYGGTGLYIGPDLILTCGHNLFGRTPDGSGTEAATAVTVRVGQQNESTWISEFTVSPSDWSVHPRWQSSGATDRNHDLSVIRVNHPPPAGEYFRMINYTPIAETPLAVCGYGGVDVDSSRQHLDIDRIRRITGDGEIIEYNLQTRRGNSGSPVFVDFTNAIPGGDAPQSIPVMGVHVASGDAQHNRGVLLTPDKIDWAMGGGVMSVSHGLSMVRGQLGGLPLVGRSRASLGGLPLGSARPSRTAPVAQSQSWARPLERSWIVVDQSNGMSVARRTFGHPSHDLSGETDLSVRVPNIPEGGSIRWNIPDETDRGRMLFVAAGGTAQSTGGNSVTLQALAAGPVAVDCMVKDASGTTVESNKYLISVPQFVFVAIHPSTDSFFDSVGMDSRKAAIHAEMRETMLDLYANVNVRFVFPGDTLPVHLGRASNPDFPGGVETLPSVYYSETIGDEAIPDPEASRAHGSAQSYRAGTLGRNHQPGDLDPPFSEHSIARSLAHRFSLIPEVASLESAATAGTLSAADLDLAALMYGRLLGENAVHEVGHFMAGSFVPHDISGFMEEGGGRSFRERTGMTRNAGSPVLTDHGRASVNRLSSTLLRSFEDFLAVNPPLDAAGLRRRGRVGSFALGRSQGWVNRTPVRPLSGESVHLPGATVLEGWQARAFIIAIETAFRSALATNPALLFMSHFVSVDTILNACDQHNITIGVGPSLGIGVQGGGSGGYGIVFAPGRRIGFYGTYSGILGWIYSASVTVQITVVQGGPENFGGESYLLGASVETVGWFDTGLLGVPVGLHKITNPQGRELGYTFEVGVGAGVPVLSLIEVYGQHAETTTTFGVRHPGRSFTASPAPGQQEVRQAVLDQAIANGASPEEAQAFVDALFFV